MAQWLRIFSLLLLTAIAEASPSVPFSFWQNPPAAAGGWTPASDANLKEWLAPNTSGNTSALWKHSAGQDCTWTAATIVPGAQNGLPAYSCNGTSTFGAIPSLGTIAPPYAVSMVFKLNSTSTGIWLDSQGTASEPAIYNNGAVYEVNNPSGVTYGPGADTSWHVLTIVFNNDGTAQYQLDGGSLTSLGSPGNASMGNGTAALYLAQGTSGSTMANMYWGELTITTSTDATTISDYNLYFRVKWNIAAP